MDFPLIDFLHDSLNIFLKIYFGIYKGKQNINDKGRCLHHKQRHI